MSGKRLLLTCLCLSVLTACVQDIIPAEPEPSDSSVLVEREFVISSEATKTFWEDGKTGFSKGDIIQYYGIKEKKVREYVITESGPSVSITTLLTPTESGLFAVYGNGSVTPDSETTFFLQQTDKTVHVQDGSFSGAHIAFATADIDAGHLLFKNASRLIKFKLERNDVRKVLFFDNNGYTMMESGCKICSIFNDNASIHTQGNDVSYIPMEIPGSGEYYISCPADICCSGGFTIELLDASGGYIGTVRSNKHLEVGRNKILDLGTLDSKVKSRDMIYQIFKTEFNPDTGEYTPIAHYSSRSGLGFDVRMEPDKERYVTTLVHADYGTDTGMNIYSGLDGTVTAIATMDAYYQVDYLDGGEHMQITKTRYSDSSGQAVTKSEILPNPNYNKSFKPQDADDYPGLNPDRVLTFYDIFSAAFGLVGFLVPSDWFDVALWVGGIGASVFDNALVGNAVTIASTYLTYTALVAATAPFAYWIAVLGMVGIVADSINNCIEEWQNNQIELHLGNAAPLTLGYKVVSDTKVELSCSVTSYVDAYVGILLADGLLINHNNHLEKQSVKTEKGKDTYTFTFSGLKPGKDYKYRAYLTHDDNTVLDYYKYGEVIEFTMLYDEDLGVSVKWASCNLGAGAFYELGNTYTLSQAKKAAEKLSGGWRLPTMDEANELIDNMIDSFYSKYGGVHGFSMVFTTAESLFFPIGKSSSSTQVGYWTTGSTSGTTPPNVRTFVYGYNGTSSNPGPYWASYGWLHANAEEKYYVRLVKDY